MSNNNYILTKSESCAGSNWGCLYVFCDKCSGRNDEQKAKPKLDRRKATSKANMQKARPAKLALQKQAREAKANSQ